MDVDTDLIVAAWHEWEIEGSDRRIVLCVETPLELRPGHDGFDRARVDALIDEATRMMRGSPSPIDRIRIVPTRTV